MKAALTSRRSAPQRPRGALPASPLSPAGEVLAGKFMGVQAPYAQARFVVLPLPYERTTSYKKGTGKGPAAFMEGSLGVELFDEELGRQTWRDGIHTLDPFSGDDPPERYLPRLEARVAELARDPDKVLFSVGGEHALSQAAIPPFVRRHPGLSVLHFDAHADLRPEYEGTPHNHACALYPISRMCRLVQVGIRSVGEEEAHLADAGNVRTFLMHENLSVEKLIPRVLRELTDSVYISIDLDGFDPSVIPGVGTPQPGGFSWYDALRLFRAVAASRRVVGVDLMELCPLEDTVHSELAAAKLAYRLMGYLSER